MSVGELSVGEMSIGELPVGEMSGYRLTGPWLGSLTPKDQADFLRLMITGPWQGSLKPQSHLTVTHVVDRSSFERSSP